MFSLVFYGSSYMLLSKTVDVSAIDQCVAGLTSYKLRSGIYPESLQELYLANSKDNPHKTSCLADPFLDVLPTEDDRERGLRYQPTKDRRNYRLTSVGLDAKSDTTDDIVMTGGGHVGLSDIMKSNESN